MTTTYNDNVKPHMHKWKYAGQEYLDSGVLFLQRKCECGTTEETNLPAVDWKNVGITGLREL